MNPRRLAIHADATQTASAGSKSSGYCRGRIRRDDLRRFQVQLRSANYEQTWHNVLLAGRIMGIVAFREPDTALISETNGPIWRIAQAGDQALFLDMQNRLVAASGG